MVSGFLLTLATDIAYAWRRLRHTPSFTVVAIVTLGLGVGANAAVFSVLDALVLRSLPVPRPGELVQLGSSGSLQTVDIFGRAAFDQFSARHDLFSGVLADAGLADYDTSYRGQLTKNQGELVSASYFSALGVQPFLGRLFIPEDDVAGRPVVALSFDYWSRVFGADPAVIGRTLTVAGKALVIVGVVPHEFSGLTVASVPDFYAPFGSEITKVVWVKVVGRLNAGVSFATAQSSLRLTFDQIAETSALPDVERQQSMTRLVVTPAGRGLSELRHRFEAPAWLLMGMVGLVLIVACANVANLFLARNARRGTEISVRLALGASRAQLVRHLAWESALVAAIGALVGIMAAHWATAALAASLGRGAVTLNIGLNLHILSFTAGMLGLAVLVCGVLPAWTSTDADITQSLQSKGTALSRDGRPARLSQILVVAQIGVSVTLLTGAGLLLHSLVNLNTFDVGFDRDRVLTMSLADATSARPSGAAGDVLSRLMDRVRDLPGVRAVSLSSLAPVSGDEVGINVAAEDGRTPASSHAFFSRVAPNYFTTLGIPLIAGRDFSAEDDPASHPVAVINRSMARHYFGDENPLGKHVKFVEGNRPPMTVIGVVADAIYKDLREQTPDFLYLCMPRHLSSVRSVLFIRSDRQAAFELATPVLNTIRDADGTVRVTGIKTMKQYIDDSLRNDRVIGELTSSFSLLALAIAAVGLYGVLSVGIAQRTREIGIRIALGADRHHILGLVARQAATLTAAGLVVGAVGAFFLTSLLVAMLFGLHREDPTTLVGVVLGLAAVAASACYFPTRRALRIDPTAALKGQ